jgi:glycosyltransferase involved in cell wall biosynthesis
MNPDKGVHLAIEVARRAGLPLVMMVKMREDPERDYFAAQVEPLLGDDVTVMFEPDEQVRIDLIGRAEAVVNPIGWPEPFGLVMAEALACGTPVVARPHGAAQEIVEHGRTGFLAETVEGLARAVARRGEIDRAACREAALTRFGMTRMVQDHLRLYDRLIAAQRVPALVERRGGRRVSALNVPGRPGPVPRPVAL